MPSIKKKLTKYLAELREGVEPGSTASVMPTAPIIGTVPPSVSPGIFKRAISLVNTIKSKTSYTTADGNDLGIEGVESSSRNLEAEKPVIEIKLVQGGKPEIVWTKGDFDGVDIWVDRGNGTWVFLATDTYPNYIDTFNLPASGQSAIWKYKSIYRYGDDIVGLWSDVASIAVG